MQPQDLQDQNKNNTQGNVSPIGKEDSNLEGGDVVAVTDEATLYSDNVKAQTQGKGEIPNMHIGEGINLVPTLTQDEITVEQRKTGANFISAIGILVIAIISAVIVGFNFITRAQLANEQEKLTALEQNVKQKGDVIAANSAIVERFDLYADVQASTFSPKEVLDYWLDLSNEFGEINRIELTGGLAFTISGDAETLPDVARLWHLLSIDEKVESITLESVSKTGVEVSYRFEGNLDFDYFIANRGSTENEIEQ
jgi:hypothetical protein